MQSSFYRLLCPSLALFAASAPCAQVEMSSSEVPGGCAGGTSPAECQPRAPSPAALRLNPPEQPGCLPSSVLFEAKIFCFSICQNKDLLFIAWLILTSNTDSHQGEEAPPIFPKWHISSQVISNKLISSSFISSPAWTEGLRPRLAGRSRERPFGPVGCRHTAPISFGTIYNPGSDGIGSRSLVPPRSDSLSTSRQDI